MTDSTSNVGKFFWRELQCGDPATARRYYGELFGWQIEDSDMPGYAMIRHEGRELGGVFQIGDDMPIPPNWQSYVCVLDVDDVAKTAKANGGTPAVEPRDIPGIGRFVVIADPAGAYVTAMSVSGPNPPVPERPPTGSFCWETVTTPDAAKTKDFYGAVFGWTTIPGPGGAIDVFAAGDTAVADIQTSKERPPHWLTYVAVDDLAASRKRAENAGGTVVVPEIPVPEVGTIALIADVFGAHLGLFEPPKG